MALSIQKRWEIIFLYSHEYGPKWSQNRIAKYFNISSHTVKKWIDRYKNTGDVKDKMEGVKEKSLRPKIN